MSAAVFPSFPDAEVIELNFSRADGSSRSLQLLVDTEFTGTSNLVLPAHASELILATLPASPTTGAIQGLQDRAWVSFVIPALKFQSTVIAILADIQSLGLPPNVIGLAGLTFLRQFMSWGSRQTQGGWEFYLSNDS